MDYLISFLCVCSLLGNDTWRNDPASAFYDYKLIQARQVLSPPHKESSNGLFRLQHLRKARECNDISTIIYRLRAGLLRNLGGILDDRLFQKSLLGTKHLIEDYTQEIVSQLEYLAFHEFEYFPEQSKLEFFTDTRQSFGNTSLLLDGGAGFGLYHLGVVKSLYENHLLPRIICGRSVGAVIAAIVCINSEETLYRVFDPSFFDFGSFKKKDVNSPPIYALFNILLRRTMRLLRYGYLMDVHVIDEVVKDNLGDITFEEAFKKTKRVLNIVVTSTRKNEVPKLMNYLTAPNVLIRTAACASMAVGGLYDTVQLLAKDVHGRIVKYGGSNIKWSDSTVDNVGPVQRLAELFNVNHIIMSQANPYYVYFMSRKYIDTPPTVLGTLTKLWKGEISHRMSQLDGLGLLPGSIKGFISVGRSSEMNVHVTIFPSVTLYDYSKLLAYPTAEQVNYWIEKGEQATWPVIARIKIRCAIELCLDSILLKLKTNNNSLAVSTYDDFPEDDHVDVLIPVHKSISNPEDKSHHGTVKKRVKSIN